MSEEKSLDPNQLEKYEPQPRGEARIPNIDIDAIDARLAECREYFTKHVDETDYRNLDWYLWRMQLKYAAGDDIFEIVDDAFLAARCLHDRHEMHLDLKPPEMFMTRRIVPVELGIISGMPMLTMEFSATYGLPLMMVIGKTAPEDIMSEANLMTSFFRRDFCADFVELTGLSAVIYAGVIAAIGRGFDDEATLGLNTYAKARDSLRGMPPKSLLAKIKRYDALNTALACLCAGQYHLIGDILAPEADAFAAEQAQKLGNAWNAPEKMPPPKYFDMSILTILALAVLRGIVIELPKTGAIAHYGDFLKGLTEMPERRIEVPGLDEEARRILKDAGVDPDQLQGNYVDHSIEDAREVSEAKAAAIFEERQRMAQEAVKAKLAQGIAEEDSHTSVEPEKIATEKLRLHDEENGDQETSRSFSDFFDQDDETDKAARKANDEIFDDTQDDSKSKDFSAFFEQDSEDDKSIRQEIEKESGFVEQETKDYSSFFDQEDKEDDSIRTHIEVEAVQAADEGHNFSSFFDNLDEKAIPEFDDGSKEDVTSNVRQYTADFFSDETKPLSGLKMTLDPDPEPEPKADPEPVQTPEPVAYEPTVEDNSPRRDFTKLFDESIPAPTIGLRMSLDDEEDKKIQASANVVQEKRIELPSQEQVVEEDAPRRDFTKLFDEDTPAPTMGLRMSLDDEEDKKILASVKSGHDVSEMDEGSALEDNAPRQDYTKLFEGDDKSEQDDALSDRETQIRELEELQARKNEEELQKKESQKLKLALDGTEQEEIKAAESYQQRMERLIAERQAAARELALREREEAERELEELKKTGVQKPQVEHLQLTPTESTDPDEKVDKVAPEDLVIKGFAYTDLDMIHDNTAQKEDLEEDFDLHAAMAETQRKEAQEKKESFSVDNDKDDDVHFVIDYNSTPEKKE